MEMEQVAHDNNTSWMLQPGYQTFVVLYPTDNRSFEQNCF